MESAPRVSASAAFSRGVAYRAAETQHLFLRGADEVWGFAGA